MLDFRRLRKGKEVGKMTNEEFIKLFRDGKLTAQRKNGNLWAMDDKILVNYSTPIAYRQQENRIFLNKTKYSVTTSKIQNLIRRNCNVIKEFEEKEFNLKFLEV